MDRRSDYPIQGTVEDLAARALDDGTLATRVDAIRVEPQVWDRKTRDALLMEASRRLRWGTLREKA